MICAYCEPKVSFVAFVLVEGVWIVVVVVVLCVCVREASKLTRHEEKRY